MFCLTASSLVLPVEVGGAWAAIVRDMGGVEMGGGGGDVDGRWREVAQRVNVKGVSQKCFRRIFVLPEAGALGEGPLPPCAHTQSQADHAPLIDRWVRNKMHGTSASAVSHFHMHQTRPSLVTVNNDPGIGMPRWLSLYSYLT
jgi:hypothetical protein